MDKEELKTGTKADYILCILRGKTPPPVIREGPFGLVFVVLFRGSRNEKEEEKEEKKIIRSYEREMFFFFTDTDSTSMYVT